MNFDVLAVNVNGEISEFFVGFQLFKVLDESWLSDVWNGNRQLKCNNKIKMTIYLWFVLQTFQLTGVLVERLWVSSFGKSVIPWLVNVKNPHSNKNKSEIRFKLSVGMLKLFLLSPHILKSYWMKFEWFQVATDQKWCEVLKCRRRRHRS